MKVIKEIKGVICEMINPIPVDENTVFPCAVRLIQDNSQMGKLNIRTQLKDLVNTNGDFIATGIDEYYKTIHATWGEGIDFERFEVIGIIKAQEEA